MRRDELNGRISEIVGRLSELLVLDRAIIQDRSSEPVVVSLDELMAYGERTEERKKLHEELKSLAVARHRGVRAPMRQV